MSDQLLELAADPIIQWPELVPLSESKLPSLNLDNFPGWVGDYINALCIATETPPELAGGMVLSACSTATARRLKVCVKEGYHEPCNLWVVVALPPGNRKSAVQSSATEPLVIWESDQAVGMALEIKRVISERKTMEARIKELRHQAAKSKNPNDIWVLTEQAADLEVKLPDIPIPPQLWTSDATPERLASLLADQEESIAWLSSEGGIFDLLQGRYTNGIPNLDLILKSHSGDPERVDRASRPPVMLRHPRLSIGLSPQPDVLRGLVDKPGFRGRGLLARFIYLLPQSPLGYRKLESPPIPDKIKQAYSAGIRAMLKWGKFSNAPGEENVHRLSLSSKAYSGWLEFAKGLEVKMRPGADLEHFTDWVGKAPGMAARIAGILHGILYAHDKPWEYQISDETMKNAIEMMAVITQHSVAALDLMGADPQNYGARIVIEWIRRDRLFNFTVREAFNKLRGTFKRVADLQKAIIFLEECGYVVLEETPVTQGAVGRPPSPTVRVRPDIF